MNDRRHAKDVVVGFAAHRLGVAATGREGERQGVQVAVCRLPVFRASRLGVAATGREGERQGVQVAVWSVRAYADTLLALTAALICLAPAAAWAQKSPMAQAARARADQHLVAARYAQAASELETAVRYEPRFAFGWYLLASSSRRAGDCDRAIAAYRRYVELRPGEPDPYFGLALCLQKIGDASSAAEAFRRYIDSDRRPASVTFAEVARKQLVEIERSLAGAAAHPASPSPALLEARDLREHGRNDEAIARYRVALAADGKSAQAHGELGALLVSIHRNQEALDDLRAAVRLNPAGAAAWYNLAFALRETGRMSEAVDAYRRFISLKPKDPDPYYGLGRALSALGRNEEAIATFQAYATLETRPTERRWVRKARAEIARLEAVQRQDSPLPPNADPPLKSVSSAGAPAAVSPSSMDAASTKPPTKAPATGAAASTIRGALPPASGSKSPAGSTVAAPTKSETRSAAPTEPPPPRQP